MSAPQTPAPLDLKTQIAAAVAVRWDEFARSHPILAGVIDQTLLPRFSFPLNDREWDRFIQNGSRLP